MLVTALKKRSEGVRKKLIKPLKGAALSMEILMQEQPRQLSFHWLRQVGHFSCLFPLAEATVPLEADSLVFLPHN